MIIIGLTGPLSQDQTACIIKNGKLLAIAEEERFVRIKHAPRLVPENAIKFCLDFAKATPEQVDIIALGWKHPFPMYLQSTLENLRSLDFKRIPLELYGISLYIGGLARLYRFLERAGFKLKGENKTKIIFYPHHLAHAASTYRCSGFEKANIITLDGQGEDDSGAIWSGINGKIKRIKRIGHHQSLGGVYHTTTEILGFKAHSQEGKVMGLAAYGKKLPIGNKLWRVFREGYFLQRGWDKKIWDLFGPIRNSSLPLTNRHKNIAYTVQNFTENAGVAIARKAYKKTKANDFCLAGGVALNCDMNAKIFNMKFVKNIFIQPAAGDAGTALGAALQTAYEYGEKADFKMEHAYWGPEFSNGQIEKTLKESKLIYKKISSVTSYTARKLAQGKIVGWFQGRSELGPRALGNRSILAHPGLQGMKDKINHFVKHREPWRPFAPSILHEEGDKYFENYCFHPFMILALKAKGIAKKQLSQTLHVDGTGRVQSVTRETNQKYYDLITAFKKITGIPALLNTSFNDKDEPLVQTPKEAIKMFFGSGMDILVLGDFVVEKK